jgi:large subunit ribosomal protein L10
MDKDQKAALVEEISSDLSATATIFAVDYRGISVAQAAELRARLAEADATFKVVKNRLAKRAAERAGTDGLQQLFEGPTALTLVGGDPVLAAKAISTFSRASGVLSYKGGIMDGEPLEPASFEAIARLPAVEVLRGQLVGVAASPLTGLARGLGALVSGLAVALGEIREKGLVGGEAEAQAEAEPPGAEAEPEAQEEHVEEEAAANEAEEEAAPEESADK